MIAHPGFHPGEYLHFHRTACVLLLPRVIRIWNVIPPHITEIENPIAFQAATINLPFTTPYHLVPIKQTNKQTS